MDNSIKADIVFASLFLLILANIFVWQFIFSLNGNLKVVFFDIGQGDSAFIETPQGHQILIDGGPGERVLTKLGKAMPFWDKTIDLIVSTHPDYDHLSGLVKVLQRYQVENIVWNGQESISKTFIDWQKVLALEKAKVFLGAKGLTVKAGQTMFSTLWPLENSSGQSFGENNELSIVLRLDYGLNKFLFTGDITTKSEKMLISEEKQKIKADVLKVAHHGSKYSSSAEFLRAVSPQTAVISCGANNRYGHPSEEVLRNLREFAINVLRTDQTGDIIIRSDGQKIY